MAEDMRLWRRYHSTQSEAKTKLETRASEDSDTEDQNVLLVADTHLVTVRMMVTLATQT
jgi:hypothetical protein